MNKEQLFAAMGGIDEAILERSENGSAKTKAILKWGALAACLGIVIAAFVLLPRQAPQTPDNTLQQEPTILECHDRNWTAQYNEEERNELSLQRALPAGYFNEKLTAQQLSLVLPLKTNGWKSCVNRAYFLNDGSVDQVVLELTTESHTVYVTLGNYFTCCIHSIDDPVISRCGDVEYEMYRYDLKNRTLLEADTKIGDVPLHFSMETEKPEQGMREFETVLECFSWYAPDCPDLGGIKPSRIPEFIDEKLHGLGEAQRYPQLGGLMLQAVPNGFAEESIRRYKDYYSDYLAGLWTRGYDEIWWQVSYFTEVDTARVTAVADTQNYDLSLYPIPRAESVPEELREIVDDPIFLAEELTLEAVRARAYKIEDAGEGAAAWRMAFGVKYGDMVVYVRTKGVDPEWLYTQLLQLRVDNN